MGLDVRIIAFRRHLPRLTDVDVANLRERLNATPARPFATGMALDDSWYEWPEKYQAHGEDAPAAHVQAVKVESGMRYFRPGYHRGDWPAFKAIILWLREHVSPDVWYGIDDVDCTGSPADDALIAEHDAAWEACGEESWYGRDDGNAVALNAEWNAVQAATLTPDQERAVHRSAHLAAFGTEPPAGKPIDFRKAFPGRVFTL